MRLTRASIISKTARRMDEVSSAPRISLNMLTVKFVASMLPIWRNGVYSLKLALSSFASNSFSMIRHGGLSGLCRLAFSKNSSGMSPARPEEPSRLAEDFDAAAREAEHFSGRLGY